MHTLVKAKLYAMLVHGFLTLIVALLTAFLVYRLWYPAPFAQLTGGTDLFLLVLGVEAVLGPVMSLVIFNPVKVRKEMVRRHFLQPPEILTSGHRVGSPPAGGEGVHDKADPSTSQVVELTWPCWADNLPSWGRNLRGLGRHPSDLRSLS